MFVVNGTGGPDGIYVTDLAVGSAPLGVAPPGCSHPRWSPLRADGTSRIAFFTGMGSLIELDSVNPDGTGRKIVIPPLSRNYFGANVRWSPHGSHLIFDVLQISRDHSIERFIYRATADGDSPTCLTKTLNSAFPLGWGTEP